MPGDNHFLKQMRIRNAPKAGPKWSVLGFRTSEALGSGPDVAELVPLDVLNWRSASREHSVSLDAALYRERVRSTRMGVR